MRNGKYESKIPESKAGFGRFDFNGLSIKLLESCRPIPASEYGFFSVYNSVVQASSIRLSSPMKSEVIRRWATCWLVYNDLLSSNEEKKRRLAAYRRKYSNEFNFLTEFIKWSKTVAPKLTTPGNPMALVLLKLEISGWDEYSTNGPFINIPVENVGLEFSAKVEEEEILKSCAKPSESKREGGRL